MEANNYVLEVKDVVKWYSQRVKSKTSKFKTIEKKVKSVDGVSFNLKAKEIMGVIGESGCGKSTLGRVLVRLEDPTSGTILINGQPADEMLKKNPLDFRKAVQIIFQNPFDTFDPRKTIDSVLLETLKLHNIGKNQEERTNIIIKSMEEVNLTPVKEYLYRYPHELSGGQLQRISILRSKMLEPSFLVADEPVSMLDVSVRAEVITLLKNFVETNDTALILISHDINTTRYISDKIAVMYLGRFVEMGVTDDVLHNPRHPYTKVLISNCSSIDSPADRKVIKIAGEPPTPIDNGPGCYFAPRCPLAKDICFKEYPKSVEVEKGHLVSCHFVK